MRGWPRDQWPHPPWRGVPGVSVHLYGKAEARAGRKMGHLTALGATPEAAADAARLARERLVAR